MKIKKIYFKKSILIRQKIYSRILNLPSLQSDGKLYKLIGNFLYDNDNIIFLQDYITQIAHKEDFEEWLTGIGVIECIEKMVYLGVANGDKKIQEYFENEKQFRKI